MPPEPERIRELPPSHRGEVLESYLDELGHMNVMWYTHVFSQGVRAVFVELGIDEAYRERERAGTFALQQFVEYRAELRVGESFDVHTRLLGVSDRRLHFKHFLLNTSRPGLAATQEALITHVDLEARRSKPWPEALARGLRELLARHEALDWSPEACGSIRAS